MAARDSTGIESRPRLGDLDVALRDGGRVGQGVRADHVLTPVTDMDFDATGGQALERARGLDIATGHVMAHRRQHAGDGAHACPTRSDDVDVARDAQVHLR